MDSSVNNLAITDGKIVIDDSVYEATKSSEPKEANFDVFSLLGALAENADMFLENDKHKRYKAFMVYMYTRDEINELLERNGKNLDGFVDSVISAIESDSISPEIASVIEDVSAMELYIGQVIRNKDLSDELNAPGREHPEKLRLLKNGALGLVKNILLLNDGSDLEKVEPEPTSLSPLKLSEYTDKEGENIFEKTLRFVFSKFKFRPKFIEHGSEPEGAEENVLKCNVYDTYLDNALSLLYNLSGELNGTKNIDFNRAKAIIGEVLDSPEMEAAFNEKKDTLAEVVKLFTTIFLTRFVLDEKSYYDVNRQLSMQLAYKMKSLVFSSDGIDNEDPCIADAWLIKYIKDRVQANIDIILTKANIHSAQDLAEIFAANGTIVKYPTEISSIDDLIFAVQVNTAREQEELELKNAREPELESGIIKEEHKSILTESEIIDGVTDEVVLKLLRDYDCREAYIKAYTKAYDETIAKLEADTTSVEEIEDEINSIKNDSSLEELAEKDEITESDILKIKEEIAEVGTKDGMSDALIINAIKDLDSTETIVEDSEELKLHDEIVEVPTERTDEITEEIVTEASEETTKEASTESVESHDVVEEVGDTTSVEGERLSRTYYTEPTPKTPEELYEAIKKDYLRILKSKDIQLFLNLRSTIHERLRNDKENKIAQEVKDFIVDKIATILTENTIKYYAKALKSSTATISDRPRAIIKCYCNEMLLGKSIFASDWRKSANTLLAVLLANECNDFLKTIGLEYAIDERTYARISKKYKTQLENVSKEVGDLIKSEISEEII